MPYGNPEGIGSAGTVHAEIGTEYTVYYKLVLYNVQFQYTVLYLLSMAWRKIKTAKQVVISSPYYKHILIL